MRNVDVAIFILTGFLAALLLGMEGSWEPVTISLTAGICLGCALFASVLRYLVPQYLAIMALPPHVDEDNLATLKYAISQSRTGHAEAHPEHEPEKGEPISSEATKSWIEEGCGAMQACLLPQDGD